MQITQSSHLLLLTLFSSGIYLAFVLSPDVQASGNLAAYTRCIAHPAKGEKSFLACVKVAPRDFPRESL